MVFQPTLLTLAAASTAAALSDGPAPAHQAGPLARRVAHGEQAAQARLSSRSSSKAAASASRESVKSSRLASKSKSLSLSRSVRDAKSTKAALSKSSSRAAAASSRAARKSSSSLSKGKSSSSSVSKSVYKSVSTALSTISSASGAGSNATLSLPTTKMVTLTKPATSASATASTASSSAPSSATSSSATLKDSDFTSLGCFSFYGYDTNPYSPFPVLTTYTSPTANFTLAACGASAELYASVDKASPITLFALKIEGSNTVCNALPGDAEVGKLTAATGGQCGEGLASTNANYRVVYEVGAGRAAEAVSAAQ